VSKPLSILGQTITGVVVNNNTPQMLQRAIRSVWAHYPDMNMIVIDNAAPRHRKDIGRLKFQWNKDNLGHAKGISQGMNRCFTDYIFLFDSDVVMTKHGLLERCLAAGGNRPWYGAGEVKLDREKMHNCGIEHEMMYLEPYCCLLDCDEFYKYRRPVDHGSPMISTMLDMAQKGHNHKLVHVDPRPFVIHEWLGSQKRGFDRSYGFKMAATTRRGGNYWSLEGS